MARYPTQQAFTETYTENTYETPQERVETYQRVMKAAANHPDKKSGALSTVVGLPRDQIRLWVDDDGKPAVVHGIETAEGHGWLDVDVTSRRFNALNTLVAAVFSGGTISERFQPAFTPDNDGVTQTRVTDSLAQLGVGTTTRSTAGSSRSEEVLPATDASVLGRVLIALGAPHGAKNSESDITIPAYLDGCPDYLCRDFAEIYLWNRGQKGGAGETVQILEKRPYQFREELKSVFERVVDGPVFLRKYGISISSEAIQKMRYD